ncbi:MAG: MarR family transcriptional regulator [Lewinellaceae bacterium]|nr:MarR family transcriptional regulator [Phaeodactylibacter sp.]MCB9038572.1 MarR family transcriptional regulator [Lewinellaceae bacterium]
MQVNKIQEQRLEQLPVFYMEQIVRQYRQLATQALKSHQAGLSVDQWVVLKQISENNGSSQVEIGSSTVKDAPTTTRIIDQLVGKNLVSKQLDPEDRRRYMVFVTEKGRQLIERLIPVVQEYRQVPLQGFSATEQKQLISLLQRMLKNLK